MNASDLNFDGRARQFHGVDHSPPPDVIAPGKVHHDYFADDFDTSACTGCYWDCCYASYSPHSIKTGCPDIRRLSSRTLFS